MRPAQRTSSPKLPAPSGSLLAPTSCFWALGGTHHRWGRVQSPLAGQAGVRDRDGPVMHGAASLVSDGPQGEQPPRRDPGAKASPPRGRGLQGRAQELPTPPPRAHCEPGRGPCRAPRGWAADRQACKPTRARSTQVRDPLLGAGDKRRLGWGGVPADPQVPSGRGSGVTGSKQGWRQQEDRDPGTALAALHPGISVAGSVYLGGLQRH